MYSPNLYWNMKYIWFCHLMCFYLRVSVHHLNPSTSHDASCDYWRGIIYYIPYTSIIAGIFFVINNTSSTKDHTLEYSQSIFGYIVFLPSSVVAQYKKLGKMNCSTCKLYILFYSKMCHNVTMDKVHIEKEITGTGEQLPEKNLRL